MAVKDISSTTIANILVLIATANQFANSYAKNTKSFKEIPGQIKKTITPDPNKASSELQAWYNTYVKSDAPAAGTATIKPTKSVSDWTSNFFTVKNELISNLTPAAMSALDAWWVKYTTYKIHGKGKW